MKQGCAYLYGRRIFLFVTARARECKKRACKHQKIRQKMTFHVVYLKGHLFAHVIFLLYLCGRKIKNIVACRRKTAGKTYGKQTECTRNRDYPHIGYGE